MLMCAFLLMHIAHETAGAARTRSSLRPLLRVACALSFWGVANLQTSGAVRRENEDSHLVVPANAGTHNPWLRLREKALAAALKPRRHGVWMPAFAGTTRGAV